MKFPSVIEHEVKRYGAYFRGWCAAFDEDELVYSNAQQGSWLLGQNKIGLIVDRSVLKQANREVLLHRKAPSLSISRHGVHFGELNFSFDQGSETRIMGAIEQLFDRQSDLHMFLTSHLLCVSESRIVTISSTRPPPIIYKPIGTLKVQYRCQRRALRA